MINNAKITKISMGLVLVALLVGPQFSYADWGGRHEERHEDHHFYRYHDHPHLGLHISFLPDDYFSVPVGRTRYYYYDGLYYTGTGRDYVLVSPPIGAVVRTIPPEYHPVTINGVTYYTDNGIYYVYTRYGYQVVPQPVVVIQPTIQTTTVASAPVTAAVGTAANSDDVFTVNIPNDKGGYTAVIIKKSGNGFVGPQGEFYGEFPKVSQLKAMYAK